MWGGGAGAGGGGGRAGGWVGGGASCPDAPNPATGGDGAPQARDPSLLGRLERSFGSPHQRGALAQRVALLTLLARRAAAACPRRQQDAAATGGARAARHVPRGSSPRRSRLRRRRGALLALQRDQRRASVLRLRALSRDGVARTVAERLLAPAQPRGVGARPPKARRCPSSGRSCAHPRSCFGSRRTRWRRAAYPGTHRSAAHSGRCASRRRTGPSRALSSQRRRSICAVALGHGLELLRTIFLRE